MATQFDATAIYHILGIFAGEIAAPKDLHDVSPYAAPIAKAFGEALSDIGQKHPGEIPAWKEAHRAYFKHISHSPVFESDQWIPTPGIEVSVNPGTADWSDDGYYSHRQGASQRLLVEMSSPPTAYFVLPGNNRDTEKHDFSDDGSPWRKWRDCRYDKVPFPLNWTGLKTGTVDF